ncbi:elongation factor 1-beta'-like isoform X2 [Macrobrachium nipponense]|uniref:elongation factor 1-beta'-like isoform X2 n=1 Tax=Macrobrachium nipponense TaxID=159736 RepID=UPI0030C8A9C0
MAIEYSHENIWFDKWRVDDAEREFYERKYLTQGAATAVDEQDTGDDAHGSECFQENRNVLEGGSGLGTLANQIAKARQEIQNSLASGGRGASGGGASADVLNRITKLEDDNSYLTKRVAALEQTIINLTNQIDSLNVSGAKTTTTSVSQKQPEKKPVAEEEDEDDDIDLFGSDDEEEDAEAARIREERLKAYAEKKSKKPGPIAKSSVLLDCKPWDDETDMKAMENEVRKIEMDGLLWGAAKLNPLAFGINKLSILCTVEDEKVSIDDLCEKIQEIEDYVQSVDIAAFNKI